MDHWYYVLGKYGSRLIFLTKTLTTLCRFMCVSDANGACEGWILLIGIEGPGNSDRPRYITRSFLLLGKSGIHTQKLRLVILSK